MHEHGIPGAGAPGLAVRLRHRLEHRVGPAQLLLSELLQLPCAELEQRVDAELEANPALELPPVPICPRCCRSAWTGTCSACDGPGPTRDRLGPTDLPAWLDRLSSPSTARERLLAEAARELRAAERPVAAHLLAEIDHLGLLPEPVSAVAARLCVDVAVVHHVLAVLRSAGAPGLGAATIVERLRLEVAALARVEPVPRSVAVLIERGLDQATDSTARDEVLAAQAWLRSRIDAEPFPRQEAAAPLPVDIVVRRERGRVDLAVDIVAGSWSGLRVAESYCLATGDPAVDAAVAHARQFLDGMARRTRTLARVTEVVVARQHRRMTEGPRAHRPLLRRDVAAELGVHESTVSRAVAGKHVLLPRGETVRFGVLFGAARGVQECLRDLVTAEAAALSDGELASALADQGHRIARRTVAKYRAALGIPPQHRR